LEKVWWVNFSFVDVIDYHPHLFRIQLDDFFNVFFLAQNFVSRCYHGHLSNFRVRRSEILFQVCFKLLYDLLKIRKINLFKSCQYEEWFVSHVRVQLSIFVNSCFKNWFAWSSIVRDRIWWKWGKIWGNVSVDRLHNDSFFFRIKDFDVWKLLSHIFTVPLENVSSFQKTVVFCVFFNSCFKISIFLHANFLKIQ